MNSLLRRAWPLVNACSRFVVPAIILIFVLTSKFKVCFEVEPKFLHLIFLGRKPRLFTKSLVDFLPQRCTVLAPAFLSCRSVPA